MSFREFLSENIVMLDGGMGTLLQARGIDKGERPERWNITHRDDIVSVHLAYLDAGANVINTNTFGANRLKFTEGELDEIIRSAIENARLAIEKTKSKAPKFVSLDIGPLGRLLRPFGDFSFEEAYEVFAEVVRLGVKYGADLVTVETMNDTYEAKAALLAVKENSSLPVIATCAFGEDGKLLTGADAAAVVALFEGLGVDALGVNCSFGPDKMTGVVRDMLKYSSVPVAVKPNAGLPEIVEGGVKYSITPSEFTHIMKEFVKEGVRLVGGCCGTTPEYIKSLFDATRGEIPKPITKKHRCVISSYSAIAELGEKPILIGERLNPTGKARFKKAIKEYDLDYILGEGIKQDEAGVHALDVNIGLPGTDEKRILSDVIRELQAVTALPLVIDTADISAMEAALRIYNGKAMINSVNGKRESMERIFPLMKKYGGVAIALTLDEGGIPKSAEGRIAIAERILSTAAEYGIDKNDIVFDTLAMTVSADEGAALETLSALSYIRNTLGVNTSLGVSNISFGLPERDLLNSSFFTAAMERGLSAGIINPFSERMMGAYYSYLALHGKDGGFEKYIAFAEKSSMAYDKVAREDTQALTLKGAILKGIKDSARELTAALLRERSALDIINEEIIPALDEVGIGFEKKTVYLPKLLISAEAAKAAFEVIKDRTEAASGDKSSGRVIIATVKGDIHDIGKNIVKLLLENYGFSVYDLGKDVAPESVLRAAVEYKPDIIALSALMTTTAPAMEKTVELLRQNGISAKIIVGGAVITEEYARAIGADAYGKDAMSAVRYAQSQMG